MNLNLSKIAIFSIFSFVTLCNGQDVNNPKLSKESIDLSYWSVTVPGENPKKPGKPLSVQYPEILEYESNPHLKKWMYNDENNESIVFYAFPSGKTTTNSHFSRSELRETMRPGDNKVNWTFGQGGYFKGVFRMDGVSKKSENKYDKTIIAQIHGRLTNEQKKLIGQKDNNAAPILKIYWDNGKIRVKTKVLKDLNVSDKDILSVDAWGDDVGTNFEHKVNFEKFTLEIIVSEGRMEVILNGYETLVYENESLRRWGVFENYFKAGNYFQSTDPEKFARVKIYYVEASHKR